MDTKNGDNILANHFVSYCYDKILEKMILK